MLAPNNGKTIGNVFTHTCNVFEFTQTYVFEVFILAYSSVIFYEKQKRKFKIYGIITSSNLELT